MPRPGSKFLTASINPTLPSWIRSSRFFGARELHCDLHHQAQIRGD